MRLIVTRPQPQASAWVEKLRADQVDAVALPLLAILPPPDGGAATARAWRELDACDGLMFVSPAAVAAWLSAKPVDATWPARLWLAAPGPGTGRDLTAAFPHHALLMPAANAEQFDSDALWQAIAHRDWRGQRVLIVHGGAGRQTLAERWRAAGAVVRDVQAYRRGAPTWDASQRALLQAALDRPRAHAWLFSSGEAVEHLLAACASTDWTLHRAVATHAAIAARARAAGFGMVVEAKPLAQEIAAALASWRVV